MKKFKRLIAVVLAVVMVYVMVPFVPGSLPAEAAGTGVQDKIDQLRSVYPAQRPCFTEFGDPCSHHPNETCRYCTLSNIPPLSSSIANLPDGKAAVQGHEAWTCHAFAIYVFYYIFGSRPQFINNTNTPQKGDFIRLVSKTNPQAQHSAIYLGENSTDYCLYDANGKKPIMDNSGKYKNTQVVTYKNYFSKGSWKILYCYHAPNYDAVNGGSYGSSSFEQATITQGKYYLANKQTGKSLSISYGKDVDGTRIDAGPRHDDNAFKFNITKTSTGYKMTPLCSTTGKLVNPYADYVTSGTEVKLYKDVNDSSQWWYFQSAGSGYYFIRNVQNPDVALSVVNPSTDSNVYDLVKVQTFNKSDQKQMWKLDAIDRQNILTVNYKTNGGTIDSTIYKNVNGYVGKISTNAVATFTYPSGSNTIYDPLSPTGLYDAGTFGLSRPGYKFVGWGTTASGGTIFDQKDSTLTPVNVTGNIKSEDCTVTLYAIWKPNTLTVNYKTNGGTINSSTYKDVSGYVCKISDSSKVSPKYPEGSKSINDPLNANGLYNASTFGLSRPGYKFVGWSTSASGGTIFDQDDGSVRPTDITSSIKNGDCTVTLYAQWASNTITVSYKTNGGVIDSTTYKDVGGYVGKLSTGAKATWIYPSPSGPSTIYDPLGVNGLYDAKTFGLSRPGYTFVGWGTTATGGTVYDQYDGTVTPYQLNPAVKNKDSSIELYAIWKKPIRDINFDDEVTMKDLTTLRRYLATWTGILINLDAADVNGDGAITMKDVTILNRYLAGWNATLG